MNQLQVLLCCVVLLSYNIVSGQSQQFDRLTIKNIPSNWSIQKKESYVLLSNYNTHSGELLNIVIMKGMPLSGKPETALAVNWKMYFNLGDSALTPRQKRNYTEDGNLYYTGGEEREGPFGNGYYMLAVYVKDKYVQTIVIEVSSQKSFKQQQYELQEILQQVVIK